MSLVSETGRTRGRKPTLSRAAILDAARSLKPHEVTLAAVGAQLGVTSPALYRYFPDRAAILEALASEAREQITPPPSDLPWDEWLREAGRRERSLWETHSELYGAADYRANSTPVVRIVTEGLRVLIAAGFSPSDALVGVTSISELAHAIGHAGTSRSRGSTEGLEEVQALLGDALPISLDQLLEESMAVVIDGLRPRLT